MRFKDVYPDYNTFEEKVINQSQSGKIDSINGRYLYKNLKEIYATYAINKLPKFLPQEFEQDFLRTWETIAITYLLEFRLTLSEKIASLLPKDLMFQGNKITSDTIYSNIGKLANYPNGANLINDSDISIMNSGDSTGKTTTLSTAIDLPTIFAKVMRTNFNFPIKDFIAEFQELFIYTDSYGKDYEQPIKPGPNYDTKDLFLNDKDKELLFSLPGPEPFKQYRHNIQLVEAVKKLQNNPIGGVSETQLLRVSNIQTESLSETARTQQEVNQEFTGAFINEKSEREAADIVINNDLSSAVADLQKQIDEGAKKITTTLWPNDTVHLIAYANNTKKTYNISPSINGFDYIKIRNHLTDVDTGKVYQTEETVQINTIDYGKPFHWVVQNPDSSYGAYYIQFNSAGTTGTIWQNGVKWNSSTNHNANGFISLYGYKNSATYGSIADNQLQVNLNTNSIEDLYIKDGTQEAKINDLETRVEILESDSGGGTVLDEITLEWLTKAQLVYQIDNEGNPEIFDKYGDSTIGLYSVEPDIWIKKSISQNRKRTVNNIAPATLTGQAVAFEQLPAALGTSSLEQDKRIDQLENEVKSLRDSIITLTKLVFPD